MNFSTHKERFFASLPKTEAQFGNLVTLREREGSSVPGIHQGFLASLIQFQPLLEIHLLDSRGNPVPWKLAAGEYDPREARRVFQTPGLTLTQKTLVHGNRVLMDLTLCREEGSQTENPLLEFSGACLFSPQGVPYHWNEERMLAWRQQGNQEIQGCWQDEVSFRLDFSSPLRDLRLKPLREEDIAKESSFTSFNLKKRYTYRVPRERRLGGKGEGEFTAGNAAYSARWEPSFDERGLAVFAFRFTAGKELPGDFPPGEIDYQEQKEGITRYWEGFAAQIPSFTCDDQDLQRIYYTSWYVLKTNQISFPQERFPYPFTSVNKFHYYNQFFWDSAFHALAWLWFNEAEPAENEMKNFVSSQWRNGMLPYELFLFSINQREWMDGDGKTSGTTQPPVIGITIKEVFSKFKNTAYPAFFYDSLLKYEIWLSRYRDLEKRGLSAYVNIWETGWDNSPRLDGAARNRVLDPYIEGVDFNVYIYLLRGVLLDMARWLGKPEPGDVRRRREMTKSSMNTFMYNRKDGFYYDLEAGTSRQIAVKTAAGLLPLLTDIPSREQKKRLLEDYLMAEKEFLTGAPVPSVSRSESSYDPQDFWRGANWPQITWSVLYGLKDEYPREAGEILDRFLGAAAKRGNCFEYYHSETGEGAGLPFQGWGALYTDFIIRFVAGINPTEKGFCFCPVSQRYTDFSLENLGYRGHILSVRRQGEDWALCWEGKGTLKIAGRAAFDVELTEEGIMVYPHLKEQRGLFSSSGEVRLEEGGRAVFPAP